MNISTHNKCLEKAQNICNNARERLAGLQEGGAEYRKAKRALTSAESAYEGALEASAGMVGAGSGRVHLLLPANIPGATNRATEASTVPSQVVGASGIAPEAEALPREEQEGQLLNPVAQDGDPEERGRGKRRRITNKLYADYDMHSDTDSDLQ